jgi:hypothetical protein
MQQQQLQQQQLQQQQLQQQQLPVLAAMDRQQRKQGLETFE